MPFVSVTREIEARAGMSLADLFNLGGPDAYRAMENDVIGDIVARDGRVVLETAGGIAGNSEALDMILARFRTVWIKAAPKSTSPASPARATPARCRATRGRSSI